MRESMVTTNAGHSRRGSFFEFQRVQHVHSATFRAVLSPCIGICRLDDAGLCEGCKRTTHEIARWGHMSDDERLRLMDVVLPLRESLAGR